MCRTVHASAWFPTIWSLNSHRQGVKLDGEQLDGDSSTTDGSCGLRLLRPFRLPVLSRIVAARAGRTPNLVRRESRFAYHHAVYSGRHPQ